LLAGADRAPRTFRRPAVADRQLRRAVAQGAFDLDVRLVKGQPLVSGPVFELTQGRSARGRRWQPPCFAEAPPIRVASACGVSRNHRRSRQILPYPRIKHQGQPYDFRVGRRRSGSALAKSDALPASTLQIIGSADAGGRENQKTFFL